MTNSGLQFFKIANEDIEVVKHFNLLGSMIEDNGGCGMKLARRFIMGRVAMGGFTKIWKDRDLSIAIKVKLVQALVFPVAIYGCETWTLNKAQNAKVQVFEQWCWRRLLRIP